MLELLHLDNHVLGREVLHSKTKEVKLDRTCIVYGKLTNKDKVFDDLWDGKNHV